MKQTIKSIDGWLFFIWLTIFFMGFVAFVSASIVVANFTLATQQMQTSIDQKYSSVEKAIKEEKDKLYGILDKMKDFEEKTLVIRRERGKYYISVSKGRNCEDKKQEKESDKKRTPGRGCN